eukprot:scaffold105169_cov18-Tisochrysis_lutea.AAC.1
MLDVSRAQCSGQDGHVLAVASLSLLHDLLGGTSLHQMNAQATVRPQQSRASFAAVQASHLFPPMRKALVTKHMGAGLSEDMPCWQLHKPLFNTQVRTPLTIRQTRAGLSKDAPRWQPHEPLTQAHPNAQTCLDHTR